MNCARLWLAFLLSMFLSGWRLGRIGMERMRMRIPFWLDSVIVFVHVEKIDTCGFHVMGRGSISNVGRSMFYRFSSINTLLPTTLCFSLLQYCSDAQTIHPNRVLPIPRLCARLPLLRKFDRVPSMKKGTTINSTSLAALCKILKRTAVTAMLL